MTKLSHPRMMARTYLLWLMFSAGVAATSGGENWPQFRGPAGLGRSSEVGLPLRWSDSHNLMWRVALPGWGASSPIALGDRLFLTSYSGYRGEEDADEPRGNIEELRLHVLCIDRVDGDIVWNRQIKPRLPESETVRNHGYAAATPATDGDHIYVFFGKSGVFKFSLDGEQIWQTVVGSKTHKWGCGTSPVLFQNFVIVNASVESGALVALDKRDGTEVWRSGGIDRSWNTPHLVDVGSGASELVVSVEGKVLAFDPANGEQLWSCAGIDDYICPSIVSQAGVLYAIGGRRSRTIAIRAGGRGDVTETHKLWEAEAGANVASPVIHDNHLYVLSDRTSVAYCVRLEDGDVVYAERLKGKPYASTLYADGRIYVVTRYDGVYVLAANPKFELLSSNELTDDGPFDASPISANGQLFLRSQRFLYCLGKQVR